MKITTRRKWRKLKGGKEVRTREKIMRGQKRLKTKGKVSNINEAGVTVNQAS